MEGGANENVRKRLMGATKRGMGCVGGRGRTLGDAVRWVEFPVPAPNYITHVRSCQSTSGMLTSFGKAELKGD